MGCGISDSKNSEKWIDKQCLPMCVMNFFAFHAPSSRPSRLELTAKNAKGIVIRYGTRKKPIGRKRNGLR